MLIKLVICNAYPGMLNAIFSKYLLKITEWAKNIKLDILRQNEANTHFFGLVLPQVYSSVHFKYTFTEISLLYSGLIFHNKTSWGKVCSKPWELTCVMWS